jgi:hypothetical protein
VSSSHPAKPGIRKKRVRQSWNTFLRPVRRWRGARWARRKLANVPAAVRIAFVVATILTVVSLASVVYQVVRKPTELLFFVGGALDKLPSETWQQYEPQCLWEIKHAHTDDGVRQEMAWAKCGHQHVLFAATARLC